MKRAADAVGVDGDVPRGLGIRTGGGAGDGDYPGPFRYAHGICGGNTVLTKVYMDTLRDIYEDDTDL